MPQRQRSEVGNGLSANLTTIEKMSKIARQEAGDPLINRLAKNIIHASGIKSHQYSEEARVIGEWVKKNFRYIRDPNGIEQLSSPIMMIRQMQEIGYAAGDCDDMSLFIATLLLSIGVQPYFRAVRYTTDSGNYNHIYIVTYEGNMKDSEVPPVRERLVIDAIIKDRPIGFEIQHKSGDEYPA